jgi:hypothetical protein
MSGRLKRRGLGQQAPKDEAVCGSSPLEVVADSVPDEYDSYVGPIATLIRENATDDALIQYLEWAEFVHMGFDRFNQDLRELGPARYSQKASSHFSKGTSPLSF